MQSTFMYTRPDMVTNICKAAGSPVNNTDTSTKVSVQVSVRVKYRVWGKVWNTSRLLLSRPPRKNVWTTAHHISWPLILLSLCPHAIPNIKRLTCIGANYTLGIATEVFTGFAGEGTLLLVLTGFPKPAFITETLSTVAYPMICSGHICRLQLLIVSSNMQSWYKTTA